MYFKDVYYLRVSFPLRYRSPGYKRLTQTLPSSFCQLEHKLERRPWPLQLSFSLLRNARAQRLHIRCAWSPFADVTQGAIRQQVLRIFPAADVHMHGRMADELDYSRIRRQSDSQHHVLFHARHRGQQSGLTRAIISFRFHRPTTDLSLFPIDFQCKLLRP